MAKVTDAQFISDVNQWPQWPFLPLKRWREGHDQEHGFLLDATDQEARFVIYKLNMFRLGELSNDQIEEAYKTCVKYKYDDVEALLRDEWMVD